MNDKLNGRRLYLPRGRDPREDLCILADTIATSEADLFNQDGHPIWITAGKCVSIIPAVLRDICTRYVATKHPRETANGWEVEYRAYEPDEMTLRALLKAKTLEEGGLVQRLPKMPGEPVRLTARQREEVQFRIKSGESPDRVANAYGARPDSGRDRAFIAG